MKTETLPLKHSMEPWHLRRYFLIPFMLACVALPQVVQAVSPPPGGCYPAYTTAEGCNALQSLATGLGNTGVGWYALFATSIGSYNTGVGAGALLSNSGDQNTATGVGALLLNTSGIQNTAEGAFALYNNTAGSGNIAVGYQAGAALTNGNNNIDIGNIGVAAESNTIRIGDSAIHAGIFLGGITATTAAAPNQVVLVNPATGQLGSADITSFGGVVITSPENTAVGDQALASNTTGASNTATGFRALFSNNADSNTATGAHALENNDAGTRNTAVGANALVFNGFGVSDDGDFNGAFGAFALFNNLDGFSNNAFGDSALLANISGAGNTAMGDLALENNDSDGAAVGNFNTGLGGQALFSNVDGASNNAVGFNAIGANTTGLFNQAMGVNALSALTDGTANIAIGDEAQSASTNGDFNTVVGDSAGQNIIAGGDNIYIGATAGNASSSDESGTIRIGDPTFVTTGCFIAAISGVSVTGSPVVVNGNGQLGISTSSARFKENIKPMERASESIYALKPVTFRYKKEFDLAGTSQFGLVAEDVEKVNPDLVVRDKEDKPYTVRYEAVNAMLLNEFLKEHRKVEELTKDFQATVAQQKKDIAALTATVKEQASQIQTVSAQLEVSKPAPQVVNNP